MQDPIAAHSFHGTRAGSLYRRPLKAAAQAGHDLLAPQVLTVLVISIAFVLFAYGENVLANFIGAA